MRSTVPYAVPHRRSFAERLGRVPERIRRAIRCGSSGIEAPGEPPRYVVYVGATVTFSPVADRRAVGSDEQHRQGGRGRGRSVRRPSAMRVAGMAADARAVRPATRRAAVAARLAASGD